MSSGLVRGSRTSRVQPVPADLDRWPLRSIRAGSRLCVRPRRFAERYPDSRIVDSYGDEWPPPCIDYWVYLERDARQVRISAEGWGYVDDVLDMSGEGVLDGIGIGNAMAHILGVAPPRSD